MDSAVFFDTHPVFTRQEFAEARDSEGTRGRRTTDSLLRKHVASGRLLRVRSGVYAVVPRGTDPTHATVDPYLVATKLAPDATVAYHAALEFWGKAYSVWHRFHYLTRSRLRGFRFRDSEFVPVQAPHAVRGNASYNLGVTEQLRGGGVARVTTLERTLVDVLDVPANAGGWEEIWRSLEMVEFFDLDAVVAYALKLGSALTVARVGFFLEQHRDALMVDDAHLDKLRKHRPRQPRYLDARRESGKLVSAWNLVVPERVISREWGEVA
jgi:predicted transcriptional regulator of viral defense system